jgi:hypothetical protein
MMLQAIMLLVYSDSVVGPNLIPRFALMSQYGMTASIYLFVWYKNLQTKYYVLVLMPFAVFVAA